MYLALCRLLRYFVVIVYSVCDGQMSYILPDWTTDFNRGECSCRPLSRLILYRYMHHISTYIYIVGIGSWLGSVCKCNCNCSCSLWIMKDESTRLDLTRVEQFHCLSQFALNSIPVFLIPFSICTHPYTRRQSVSMRSLLLSIINHITEIPKQSEGYN